MAKALDGNLPDTGQIATCNVCGRHSGKGWSFAFKKPVPDGAPDDGVIIINLSGRGDKDLHTVLERRGVSQKAGASTFPTGLTADG